MVTAIARPRRPRVPLDSSGYLIIQRPRGIKGKRFRGLGEELAGLDLVALDLAHHFLNPTTAVAFGEADLVDVGAAHRHAIVKCEGVVN